MVLLKHVSTKSLLVASSVKGGNSFQCQRATARNMSSWGVIGFKNKTTMTFEQPAGGFRAGKRVELRGEIYDVMGFSSDGWAPAWNKIV